MNASEIIPIQKNSDFCDNHSMKTDDFVRRLRDRIEQDPDLTAAGLAAKSGIDVSTIRKMLTIEGASPRYATAQKICAALGTTLEVFMSNDQDTLRAEIVHLYSQLSDDERRILQGVAKGMIAQHREEG